MASKAPAAWQQNLQTTWTDMAARERKLVMLAIGLIVLALLWWVLLAPAIKIIRDSRAENANLDTQVATMQSLAQEAKTLQSQAQTSPDLLRQQRETSIKKCGTLKDPNSSQIVINNLGGAQLAQCLQELELTQAQLSKSGQKWSGSISPMPLGNPTTIAVPQAQ